MPAVFGKITKATPCSRCDEEITENSEAAAEFEWNDNTSYYDALIFHPQCLVTGQIMQVQSLLEQGQ